MLEFPPTVNSRTRGISYHDTALMSPLIPEQLSISCHQPWYSASGVSGAAPDGSGSVIVTHEEMTTRRYANLRINFGVSIFFRSIIFAAGGAQGDISTRLSDRGLL